MELINLKIKLMEIKDFRQEIFIIAIYILKKNLIYLCVNFFLNIKLKVHSFLIYNVYYHVFINLITLYIILIIILII
jgi:hypothetical protein